jgi:hypothetical protein
MTLEEAIAKIEELTEGVSALSAKNKELLAEKKVLQAKAKGADIDPAEHAALQTKVDELTEQLGASSKKGQAEIEKLTKQLTEKDGALRKHLVDEGLTAAAIKAGVAPHYLDAVKALHGSKVQVEVKDGAYVALLDGKPLADGLTTWAQSDHGKHFVSAPANSGGGAQGGGGSSNGKTIQKSEFDAMKPAARADFIAKNAGVQIVD